MTATALSAWGSAADRRPPRSHGRRGLLASREPLSGNADHTVETSGRSLAEIVRELTKAVGV
jgi:hypothetical protein